MIRDVTEFRRAEVGCLWVNELETPVGARPAARRRTGRRDGARTCAFPVPPAATDSAGHRVQRVTVRCRASPPYPAAGVTPDQIPEADRGHHWPPDRTAATAGPCAAPGPTRHATAATLSIGELLARATRRDPSAWAEIIRRYNGVVWARVRSFRLQDADTVDAVQMTWLRLSENCGRVQHPDRLGGWLATTATRETLQILHHTKQTATVDDLADTGP